jgi:hypothetical protein
MVYVEDPIWHAGIVSSQSTRCLAYSLTFTRRERPLNRRRYPQEQYSQDEPKLPLECLSASLKAFYRLPLHQNGNWQFEITHTSLEENAL